MKLDKKFSETITQALIERIKTIEENRWERPWFDNPGMRPKNLDGEAYNGLNKFLLSMLDGGRDIPVYMTFLRAKREGLSVLSGEKSLPVQYANKVAFHKETKKSISIEKYEELTPSEKEEYNIAFMMKHYNVFNVDQTNMKEVNPELYEQLKEQVKLEQRVLKETASPLFSLVENQSWYTPIKLDQVDRAYYTPFQDEIHLPKREFFKSDDLFYSTMLHEMSHSTGHKSRLNREIHNEFGSPKYSREELVAELSSAIVGQQYGVSKTILEDNAHYLHSWLDAIKQEPEFLNEVLEDVLNASNMIVDKVELVQKENIDKAMDTNEIDQIKKATKQGKSAYDLQAQYSRINGEYPFSVTTDREKQVVHRIKQAENIIKVYNENISDYLGENYYQDKEKVYQVIPKEIYAKPKVMERTIEQREYSTEQRSSEVEEPKINYDVVPITELYANEKLMTATAVRKKNISLPEDILSSINSREQILQELEVTYSPDKEQTLLEKKMILEDDIREKLRSLLATKYMFNLVAHLSYEDKYKSLGEVSEYVPIQATKERMLHDGLHDRLPVLVTSQDNQEVRNKLDEYDIEYEILPSKKLRYRGVARMQEGYILANTQSNKDFLEQNDITYSQVRGNYLFVSMRAQKVALLLASTIIFTPVVGLAVMYAMNKSLVLEKLLKNKQFTNEEAKRLNNGETIRRSTTENGRPIEKYFFVDNDTHRIRSIPVNEVQLPNRINGVELSVKDLDDLRMGNKISGYDKGSGMYYEAKLDLNNIKTIEMGFKELKAEKEFTYVPKPNSPDADKVRYVQLHGAQGVNDIWEMGGVNLERDSFLDKYDVEGFYKDYLSASQNQDKSKADDLSSSIQNNMSKEKSIGLSR